MKEIDFLPEWYKSGIRRQVNYRLQYIILSGVFAVMIVWNFVSAGSVSKVRAKYIQMETIQLQTEKTSAKLEEYKKEIAVLHEKEKLSDSIDSNINVSNVLAELSFLIDEKIVLSGIELVSEIIPDKQNKEKNPQSLSVVRSSVSGNNSGALLGNVRFRVLIDGVAANGSDVAALLCKLEDSVYFNRVNLLYSKDASVNKIKSGSKNLQQDDSSELNKNQNKNNNENIKVSEFEISCYLSNYVQSR